MLLILCCFIPGSTPTSALFVGVNIRSLKHRKEVGEFSYKRWDLKASHCQLMYNLQWIHYWMLTNWCLPFYSIAIFGKIWNLVQFSKWYLMETTFSCQESQEILGSSITGMFKWFERFLISATALGLNKAAIDLVTWYTTFKWMMHNWDIHTVV